MKVAELSTLDRYQTIYRVVVVDHLQNYSVIGIYSHFPFRYLMSIPQGHLGAAIFCKRRRGTEATATVRSINSALQKAPLPSTLSTAGSLASVQETRISEINLGWNNRLDPTSIRIIESVQYLYAMRLLGETSIGLKFRPSCRLQTHDAAPSECRDCAITRR